MMKKRFLFLVILVAVLIIMAFVFIGTTFGLKEKIYSEISNANFCNTDSDCIIVDFGCPFGCGSYMNKDTDIEKIKGLIAKYNQCEYKCMTPPEPKCLKGRCSLPDCEIDKAYENMYPLRNCKCPSGSDVVSVPGDENNKFFYKCRITICEIGEKYETAWRSDNGLWWDRCVCPEGTKKSSKFKMSGLYFFRCK